MKSFKDFTEETLLWEMANLPPSITGIDKYSLHIYPYGPGIQHGPRVKVYEKRQEICEVRLTSKGNKLILSKGCRLTKKARGQILEYISDNKKEIIRYWKADGELAQSQLNLRPLQTAGTAPMFEDIVIS